MPINTTPDWWKDAVIYQIYPKSFQDTDGNGIGDIPGIIAHLDYLKNLGADALWLSPVYPSPQRDNGYDVADYYGIDPVFGTMQDFDLLTAEAEKRNMGIIMDLVLNHTSDQHPWFQAASRDREDPLHDYYIWSDTDDGTKAVFGDPAWTYVPQVCRYYYGSFSPYQPDLNWENPQVRRAVRDIMLFWKEKGVVGFRLDAVPYISKDLRNGIRHTGPDLHPYLRELRQAVSPDGRLALCGEDTEAELEDACIYTAPSGKELSLIFEFGQGFYNSGEDDKWTVRPLDLPGLKAHYAQWQHGLHNTGWMALFLMNHDMPRIVSDWGDDGKWRRESAKMLAAAVYLMQGTVCIYQGEELGMANSRMSIEEYQDMETLNYYRKCLEAGEKPEKIMEAVHARSRDNARTPMQWSDGRQAGFTSGTPWLRVNPDYRTVNAAREEQDPDSVLAFYKKLLALRRSRDVFREGSVQFVDPGNPAVFAYVREKDGERVLVECNFTSAVQPRIQLQGRQKCEVLLGNYAGTAEILRPYETVVTAGV